MMIVSPKLTFVATKMKNHYLQKIGDFEGAHAILETCDEIGIIQRGYEVIFKKFKISVSSVGKRQLPCFLKPHLDFVGRHEQQISKLYW